MAHRIVDAAAGKNNFGRVAQASGFVGQVERVDADAVAAHEAGRELEEVPLGAGGGEHVAHVEIHAAHDEGELVHERDIDVALGVLDDFGGFGGLDRGGAEDAGGDDAAVDGGDRLECGGVLARDHLGDLGEGMLLVARIDALGGVANGEVLAAFQARAFFEHWYAVVLGRTGVDGRFVNDDIAFF